MQAVKFDSEFVRVFRRLTNTQVAAEKDFDINVYKKVWRLLMHGEAYYFVINHHSQNVEQVSSEVQTVMGYTPDEFTIDFMNEKLHPDDRGWFLTIGKSIADFFATLPLVKKKKYVVRYDIRFRKRSGDYARILYQGLLLEHDSDGHFLRTISTHTDITYLKKEGAPTLSFIGLDGEPSFRNIMSKNNFIESKEEFTIREKQVLELLIEGKLSKEISGILDITKQTVDTHRKNMLRKKNLGNTSELVSKAIHNGWV